MLRWIVAAACALAPVEAFGQESTLVPAGALWRHLDDGSDAGTTWREPLFDDSAWAEGPAQLGYGDGDEATVVQSGPKDAHFVTTYFRTGSTSRPRRRWRSSRCRCSGTTARWST